MLISRKQYLDAIIRKKDNGRVKIITGIRRCGKSFLLFELYKQYLLDSGVSNDCIIELPLDELKNAKFRNPFSMDEFIRDRASDKNKKYYVFIDEVQFCAPVPNPYIEKSNESITFVDTLLGLMKEKNLDIYVTGSNSKMLSKDILTQFRDRGDEIHVYPLSFSEYYTAVLDEGYTREDAWRDYCSFGGMPYTLYLDTVEEKSKYLKDLFEETYIKDIVDRNDIRNEKDVLDTLIDFISSSVGSLTNPTKLENRFASVKGIKISHATIGRYIEMFEEAYILSSSHRYDIKGSKYFDTPLKYYYADIGLRNARLNFRQYEESHIMENIVYNDLIRRGYCVDVGVVEYNVREKSDSGEICKVRKQLEVDFVVNKGSKRFYIQSAYNIDNPEKKEQELNSLLKINDSFKKIVIVKDNIVPWHDEKGILYLSIWDFLLDDSAIEVL